MATTEEKLRKLLLNNEFQSTLHRLLEIIEKDFDKTEWDFVTGFVVGHIVERFKPEIGQKVTLAFPEETIPTFSVGKLSPTKRYLMDCGHTLEVEWTTFKKGQSAYCAYCEKETKIVRECVD